MRIKRAAMVFMVASWGLATCATTYYADNKAGNDANDGLSAEKAFRTLAVATARLKPGDVLEISPGRIYYESLNIVTSGTPEKPVTVRGHGAVISGLAPVPDNSWKDCGEGLWHSPNTFQHGALRPRVLDAAGRMISVVCGAPKSVPPKKLKPGESIWNGEGIFLRLAAGQTPVGMGLQGFYRATGVTINKQNYIVVEDIVAEHFANDGVNVHGCCHGLVFRNITTRWNGDDGFSIHEDVMANVYGLTTHHNDFGIQDVNASQSFFCGVNSFSNRMCGVDFHGGMRILRDATVYDNGGGQIRVRAGKAGQLGFAATNPMCRTRAYIKNVKVSGGAGEALMVGAGTDACAMECSFSGTDVGLSVQGELHFLKSTVENCRTANIQCAESGRLVK